MMRGAALACLALAGSSALTGCGDAVAEPAATEPVVFERLHVAPGAGWIRMRAVEAAATAAAAKIAAATTTIEAWGDPATGCYAIGVDARGTRAEGLATSAHRLATELAPLGVDPAAMPRPTGDALDAALPIALGELTGTLAVRLYRDREGVTHGLALACASNPREPARCKILCDGLFAQMAPPVMP